MRRLKRVPRHWAVPSALAAALVAALFISPAIGGPNFITKKKVVKTIGKKANALQVTSPAIKPVPAGPERLLLTLDLPRQGSYLVRSTFGVIRETQGYVTCRLRIGGVAEDTASSAADAPAGAQEEETVAMETAGQISGPTQVQLTCQSALPGTSVRYVEITAEKIPKLIVVPG